jgi:hypothetical protein
MTRRGMEPGDHVRDQMRRRNLREVSPIRPKPARTSRRTSRLRPPSRVPSPEWHLVLHIRNTTRVWGDAETVRAGSWGFMDTAAWAILPSNVGGLAVICEILVQTLLRQGGETCASFSSS